MALPRRAGMNRFVWDLRYGAVPGSAANQPGGPMVPPGAYKARLTADGVTRTEALTVKIDPRVAKDGIAVGTDRDESSVAGRVHVGGGRAQQHVPSTLANGTRVPVLGKDAFEEAENRLVKGHVDDLTAARVGAPL